MTEVSFCYRSFGSLGEESEDLELSRTDQLDNTKCDVVLRNLRGNIIGNYSNFISPFGQCPCLYVDWTASGRALKQIEDYISSEVLPLYGNTHTTTSITGHQSTCFRQEARQIVAQSVNAKITGKAASDLVLFSGNGTTAAVLKLIYALELHIPLPKEYEDDISYRPIVFTSSYEHHSNLLPWRESIADVITIRYHPVTGVCLIDLEDKLQYYQSRRFKIGAFSAASNVTGILTEADAVAVILHRAGALAFFDYATAAPYVKIDMNPVAINTSRLLLASHHPQVDYWEASLAYKDAVYFSGHKFLGGPGCPGVLVVKKRVMTSLTSAPAVPGGGTVFFVTENHHRFLSNHEEREEAGTPHLLGDVKLGLVMHLQQTIGSEWIEREEIRISQWVVSQLENHRNIILLGQYNSSSQSAADISSSNSSNDSRGRHLPIFSFLIQNGNKLLHYNLVCALLNDLFGIQSRGGCQCAGPFSHLLLGLNGADSVVIESLLLDKYELYRPGYSRLSLPFWMSQEEIVYVINAVKLIADYGYLFLKFYRCNPRTGEWTHSSRFRKFPERKWLSSLNFLSASTSSTSSSAPDHPSSNTMPPSSDSFGGLSPSEILHTTRTRAESLVTQLLLDAEKGRRPTSAVPVAVVPVAVVPVAAEGGGGGNIRHSAALDNMKWFLDSEDIPLLENNVKYSNSQTLFGPLQPTRWSQSLRNGSYETQDDDVSVSGSGSAGTHSESNNGLTCSVYGVQRSGSKLRSREGRGEQLPRYASLTSDRDALDTALYHTKDVVSIKTQVTPPDVVVDTAIKTHTKNTSSSIANQEKIDGDTTTRTNLESARENHNNLTTEITSHETDSTSTTVTTPSTNPILSVKSKPISLAKVPPKKLMKLVGKAIKDWSMIVEGDRLLLGLSGGKDSLALLHILLAVQKRAPVRFEIACATVDPQTSSFDPSPLIPYVKSLGVEYHYLSEPIVELAKSKLQGDSLCAFCARMKRGLLYSCCRTNGYTKLVLAQHLDDLAESFLMSALHNGQVRTMKACYAIEAGDLHVIRPVVYAREKELRNFSVSSGLPIINENCPACFEQPKERARVKELLKQEEVMLPSLFCNLRKALIPLMHDDTYETMRSIANRIEESSRQGYSTGSKSSSNNSSGTGKKNKTSEKEVEGDVKDPSSSSSNTTGADNCSNSEENMSTNKPKPKPIGSTEFYLKNTEYAKPEKIIKNNKRKHQNEELLTEGSQAVHNDEVPVPLSKSSKFSPNDFVDAAEEIEEEEEDMMASDSVSSSSLVCGLDKDGPPCYELA